MRWQHVLSFPATVLPAKHPLRGKNGYTKSRIVELPRKKLGYIIIRQGDGWIVSYRQIKIAIFPGVDREATSLRRKLLSDRESCHKLPFLVQTKIYGNLIVYNVRFS